MPLFIFIINIISIFHFYIYKLPILMSPKTRENTPFYKVFQKYFKKIINFFKLIYIIILYINLSDQIVLNCGYKLDINVLYTNKI